jgi:hypothetical protein
MPGWRQHEQTYDSLSAVNTSIRRLTLLYAYLYRVNRTAARRFRCRPTPPPSSTGLANYFKSDSM